MAECSSTLGEAAFSAGHVFRDAQGRLLVASAADTPYPPGGDLFFPTELLPEVNVRVVHRPGESCAYLPPALELTAVSTKKKVVVPMGQRAELLVNDTVYVFGVQGVSDSGPNQCGNANWIIFKKGFFHGRP